MRSTRNNPINWEYVASPNANTVSLVPRKADTPREMDPMIQRTVQKLLEHPFRVRVTQAYAGVKHTFGMQIIGGSLIIWDVNGSAVYDQPNRFGQMKYFVDEVSTALNILETKTIPIEFREPTKSLYKEIKKNYPDQMCVTYIDNYVIPNNNYLELDF